MLRIPRPFSRHAHVTLTLFVLFAASFPQDAKPSDPAPLLLEARSLYRKGAYDQALAKYSDALKADPHSGQAYAGIVRCDLKLDKIDEAQKTVDQGMKSSIEQQDFSVAQGELLFRQGKILEAETRFEEVIADVPPNAQAYLGAARVANASANYAREHDYINKAHQIDPNDPEVQKKWAQGQSLNDLIRFLEEFLARPGNGDDDSRRRMSDQLEYLKGYRASHHTGGCHLVSTASTADIPMMPILLRGGRSSQSEGIQVTINGRDSKLLLDTGSSGILISGKLAHLIGLKKVSDVRISGIGDKPDAQGYAAYADSVTVGNLEFHDCRIEVVEKLGAADDGIIGTDVFSQFLIEMDFPTSRFRLSELPARSGELPSTSLMTGGSDAPAAEPEAKPAEGSNAKAATPSPRYFDSYVSPEMHHYVPAFRIDHMLLLPTTINQGPEKLFLLDSGSFDNTIDIDAAREVAKVHRAPRREVGGLNGDVKKVYVADEVVLDFGHLRQTVPDMVAFDMSHISRNTGVEISGSLGMVMLNMLKVRLDYRDGLVDFEYVPKKPRR